MLGLKLNHVSKRGHGSLWKNPLVDSSHENPLMQSFGFSFCCYPEAILSRAIEQAVEFP